MKMSAQTLRLGIVALAVSLSVMLEAGTPPDRTFIPGDASSPYGVVNLDAFAASADYQYCKWGVLMSEGYASFVSTNKIYDVTPLTPQNQRDKLFFLSGHTGNATSGLTQSGIDWLNDGSFTIPYAELPFFSTLLMRQYHFPSSLQDVRGAGPTFPLIGPSTKKVVVLIHGWNPGSASNSYDDLAEDKDFYLLSEALKRALAGTEWALVQYRWEKDADTGPIFSPTGILGINGSEAAEAGRWHGYHLGELLERLTDQQLQKAHFIVHSAGTWVGRGAIKYLLSARANSPSAPNIKTQLTLLDPFIPSELGAQDGSLESQLTPELINQLATTLGANSDSLFRLENYFANDVITGNATKVSFSWRGGTWDEAGFKVGNIGNVGAILPESGYINDPYGSHAGPILFYADTVEVSTFGHSATNSRWSRLAAAQTSPIHMETEEALNTWGWRRSMFFNEPLVTAHPSAPPTAVAVGASVTFSARAVLRGNRQSNPWTSPIEYLWEQRLAGGQWETLRSWQIDLTGTGSSYIVSSVQSGMNNMEVRAQIRTRAGYEVTNATTLRVNTGTPPTTITAPAAPSNVQAVALSSTSVSISWKDNSSNETSFRVQRRPAAGGAWVTRGTTGPGTQQATDSVGLSPGSSYIYQVTAFNGSLASADVVSSVVSTFSGAPPQRQLTVTSVNPFSGISYTLAPTAVSSPSSGVFRYLHGTEVTLTAPGTAPNGNVFQRWEKDGLPFVTSQSVTVVLDADHLLSMIFAAPTVTPSYTVSLVGEPSAGGSVTGGGSFGSGALIVVEAAPSAGYRFVNWTLGGQVFSLSPNLSFQVTGNTSLVANFAPTAGTYTVATSSNPVAGGTTSGAGSYSSGQTVTLNATPADGWLFGTWTDENGTLAGFTSTLTFPAYQNRTLKATFTPDLSKNYYLSMTANNGTAIRTPNQTGYAPGSTVEIQATPAIGYFFSGWSGDATGSNNPLTMIMTANKSITANFTAAPPNTYTLSVNSSTRGSVSKNPDQPFYNAGTVVTLQASPTQGNVFAGWRRGAFGIANQVQVTMNSDKLVAPNFIPTSPSSARLTISTPFSVNVGYQAGDNNGNYYSVSNTGSGTMYYHGTATVSWLQVNSGGTDVSAGGSSGLAISWEENTASIARSGEVWIYAPGAQNSPQIYTITQAAGVPKYALAVNAINGSVARTPNTPTYSSGSSVTLNATPSEGYAFAGWSGDTSGTQNPLTVVMNEAKDITANFLKLPAPDLKPEFNLSSSSMIAGLSVGVTGTIKNIGTDPSSACKAYFRLTSSATVPPTITTEDAPFIDVSSLAANAQQSISSSVASSASLAPGTYYLWALVDPEKAGNEQTSARTDNYVVTSILVLPDTMHPSVEITTPTTSVTVATSTTISMSGVAADNVGVAQVNWVNNRGGSGTALGRSIWSIPAVSLSEGENVISVTAIDAVGNHATDMITVINYLSDQTPPAINIIYPTAAGKLALQESKISLGGVASDDGAGLASISWANDRGGIGDCVGKESWVVADIPLQPGVNIITVTATDRANNQTTSSLTIAAAITLGSTDPNRPTILIKTPTDKARVEGEALVISGTAAAKRGVQSILYRLDDGAWTEQSAGGGASTAWSIELSVPSSGAHAIHVRSKDVAGYVSPVFSRLFTFVVRANLALSIAGEGTLTYSGFTNTSGLEIGKNYTLSAKPRTGHIFAGFSGSFVSAQPVISFTMQEGMALTATFVPNPFGAVAGTYLGLVRAESDSHATSGLLRATVTTAGAFSGTLLLGGKSYSLSGKFDSKGQWVGQIARSKLVPLSVLLMLDVTGGSDTLTGLVSDGRFTAAIHTNRATFKAITNAAPSAGKYTFAIAPEAGDATAPPGYGAGTLVVDAAGKATLAGKLADTTAITFTSQVSKNGSWPLHVLLYTSTGSITGEILFADLPGSDSAGGLYWFKPVRPADAYFKNGFDTQPRLLAQRFTSPAKNTRLLTDWDASFGAGTLKVSSVDLLTVLSQPVTWTTSNLIQSDGSILPSLKVMPVVGTGLFSGSFLHPTTRKAMPFSGALLQKTHESLGWLQGATSTGGVMLERSSTP